MTGSAAAALRKGFAKLEAGDARGAAACCKAALAAEPDNPRGHFLVGLAASALNDWPTAARAFGAVIKLDPTSAAGHAQLARALLTLGRPLQAETALADAAARAEDAPNAPDAAVADLIGMCHGLLGAHAAARGWHARAVAAVRDNPAYAVNYATCLSTLGETAAATAACERVLAREPENPQAHWLRGSLVRATDVADAERLRARADAARGPIARAFLAYAAGKAFEDVADWPRAFEAYSLGAAAKRATLAYDETAETAAFDALAETYDAAWRARAGDGVDDPSPIFVVGQPRTGTTLIERILTSHSAVASAGEPQQFGLSVRRLAGVRGAGRWSADVARAAASIDPQALGREYLRALAPIRPDAPRFVDKLPGNYQHLPLILAALPKARIVHVRRGAMDACFASFKQLFADAYPHSYDQAETARHHVRYRRLMDCWRAAFPGRFFEISYEETVADLEPNARALIAAAGLEWEPACLDFHRQAAPVATASATQVREPAHTRSVGRWRRYGDRLAPMRAVLENAGVPLD